MMLHSIISYILYTRLSDNKIEDVKNICFFGLVYHKLGQSETKNEVDLSIAGSDLQSSIDALMYLIC